MNGNLLVEELIRFHCAYKELKLQTKAGRMPALPPFVVPIRKGAFAMSLGNIAGSNIFNILWILGFASILNPLTIDFNKIYPDLIFLVFITLLFYGGILKGRLTKGEGILYIALYIGYIYYLL